MDEFTMHPAHTLLTYMHFPYLLWSYISEEKDDLNVTELTVQFGLLVIL